MNDLILNIDKIHTTEGGLVRIKKNLQLLNEDAVAWCKEQIILPDANTYKRGKNWYVEIGDIIITINSYNYSIITAHRK